MTTAQALTSRRRNSRRGHFFRTGKSSERPYAPSREALEFKPHDVTVSVGEA